MGVYGGLKSGAGKVVRIPRPLSCTCFQFPSPGAKRGRARRNVVIHLKITECEV